MRPQRRNDFTIAIICALVLEADAVEALFDETYDGPGKSYGKAPGDANAYANGRIGKHNVVLCYLPGMGKGSAASVASTLRVSYPQVELALVVGICGGAPSTSDGKNTPIYLGDVLISDAVIEYDFGRRYPDGFRRKTDVKSSLGGSSREIQAFLNKLIASRTHSELEKRVSECLDTLQQRESKWRHPGTIEPKIIDVLFDASYVHRHRSTDVELNCRCSEAHGVVSLCNDALRKNCDSLGCSHASIVRQRTFEETPCGPSVHIGPIASADTVLMSGNIATRLFATRKLLASKWKGQDHKSKTWKDYAAAAGASAAKAFLEYWEPSYQDIKNTPYTIIRFPRNLRFVGRQSELRQLEEWISLPDGPKKLAITGLGGMGKTQIALELAYRMRDRDTQCSVFWIPCTSVEAVDQAYMAIADRVGIHAKPDTVRSQIKDYFTQWNTKWFIIFDNADDIGMWTENSNGTPALKDLLPYSDQGHILFTTRTRKVAARLASAPKYVMHVLEPSTDDALELLRQSGLREEVLDDTGTCITLLEQLAFLPLAIAQATSFIYENDTGLSDYLTLLQQEESEVIELLSEEFDDEGRYKDLQNPVAVTWFISFKQIQRLDQLAITYLSLMACLNPQDIPLSFLPKAESKTAATKALGTLCAYSLITTQQENGSVSMHRLVFLATRNWLRSEQKYPLYILEAADRFDDIFPDSYDANRYLWRGYLPHVLRLFESAELESCQESNKYTHLRERLGMCLFQDARYNEAEHFLVSVIDSKKKEYGTTDHRTLSSMTILTVVYMAQGQWSEAEDLGAQTMVLCRRTLEPSHDTALHIMVNLASIYIHQGKFHEAEILQLEVFGIQSQVLQEDDPRILATMAQLATTYAWQGRYKEEAELCERILNTRKHVLGPHRAETLETMSSLAWCYNNQGRLEEELKNLESVWEASRQELGSDHPNTLDVAARIAYLYNKQGQADTAEKMLEQAISRAREVLGANHHRTLMYMSTLAGVHFTQERFVQAKELHEYVLEGRRDVLGSEHPGTLLTMHNLAMTWDKLGKQIEAVQLMTDCVELRTKHLGPDHPQTKDSTKWLESRRKPVVKEESLGLEEAEMEDRKTEECRNRKTREGDSDEETPMKRQKRESLSPFRSK
ncbi:uncharacterized protein BDV17DRAFT_294909 [Aspergillus undulatus]|uniref:uncharacterized protein n=1 Tax=Aspergillus undulatus TaxID=1810928 RepID=UPI003CCD440A